MPCATLCRLLDGSLADQAPVPVSNYRHGDRVQFASGSLKGLDGTVIMKPDFPSLAGAVHVQIREPSWNGYIARDVQEAEIDLILGGRG